jgi:hypothetical protein
MSKKMEGKTRDYYKNMDKMDMALHKLQLNANEDAYTKSNKKYKYDMKLHRDIITDKRERKWMVRHGKEYMLDFNDQELHKLKECFG